MTDTSTPMGLGGAGLWHAISAREWFKVRRSRAPAEGLAEIEKDLMSV
jgi:hypothetical protein